MFYAAVVPKEPLPPLKPLDPPTVPFAIGGMVIWGVLGLVLLGFRSTLSAHGHTDVLWICLAGFVLGIPGLGIMIVHDRHRRQRRQADSATDDDDVAERAVDGAASGSMG